jgi:hypothetical protein
MATIDLMFKDIDNARLRQYFVEALAKVVRVIPIDVQQSLDLKSIT